MLLQCIKESAFVPPLERKGQVLQSDDPPSISDAPKIKPQDRHVDWSTWTANQITRAHKAIGPLWNTVYFKSENKFTAQTKLKRVIWSSGFQEVDELSFSGIEPGVPFCRNDGTGTASAYVQTCDDKCLEVKQITIDGGQKSNPESSAKHAGAFCGKSLRHIETGEAQSNIYALFHAPMA